MGSTGWNGVDTSRVPGCATQEAPGGHCGAPEQSVHLQRLHGVRATAGVEPAVRAERGGDPPLVEAQQHDQRNRQWGRPVRRGPAHRRAAVRSSPRPEPEPGTGPESRPEPDPRPAPRPDWRGGANVARSARSSSMPSRADSAAAEPGNARTTRRLPAGRSASRSRIRWRSRRATRCRTTEPPTALLTTKPTCGQGAGTSGTESGTKTCITTSVRPARRPRRITAAKSSRWVSRAAAGNTARRAGSGRQLLPALAPAGGQDRPAGPGPHAQPEAVGTRTTAVVRLKRTLALAHFSAPVQLTRWTVYAVDLPGRGAPAGQGPARTTRLTAWHSAPASDAVTQRVRSQLSGGQTGWLRPSSSRRGTTRSRPDTSSRAEARPGREGAGRTHLWPVPPVVNVAGSSFGPE